jgi:carbon monoxide dehydrogenase subunit G
MIKRIAVGIAALLGRRLLRNAVRGLVKRLFRR